VGQSTLSFGNVGPAILPIRVAFPEASPNSESSGSASNEKGSVFVQHTLLTLKNEVCQSLLMGSEFVFDTFSIRVMYPVKPFFQFVTDFAFRG